MIFCLNHDFYKIYKISKINNPVHLDNLVKIMVRDEDKNENIKKIVHLHFNEK